MSKRLIIVILDESGSMGIKTSDGLGEFAKFINEQKQIENKISRIYSLTFNTKGGVFQKALSEDNKVYERCHKKLRKVVKVYKSTSFEYWKPNINLLENIDQISCCTQNTLEKNTIEEVNGLGFVEKLLLEKYSHKNINFKQNNNKIVDTIRWGYYKINFNELNQLGSGGFGTVFKVMCKSNKILYAVKKILIKDIDDIERVKKEVNTLIKCSSDYVVQYFDSWIENNSLNIQMELCSDNLKNIITQKSKCFEREQSDAMSPMEYFMSSQLFKELLECVQFLHESNPPIIHRDIKPQNILITEKKRNNRFLKICDFGLATDHGLNTNSMTHTNDMGTGIYMAPEVFGINGKCRYSTKADIYSLSIVLQEMFDFDIYSSDKTIKNSNELKLKWKELETVIAKMNSRRYKDRPTCDQLLSSIQLWSITVDELINTVDYHKNIEQMRNFSNQFFYEFFKEKMLS